MVIFVFHFFVWAYASCTLNLLSYSNTSKTQFTWSTWAIPWETHRTIHLGGIRKKSFINKYIEAFQNCEQTALSFNYVNFAALVGGDPCKKRSAGAEDLSSYRAAIGSWPFCWRIYFARGSHNSRCATIPTRGLLSYHSYLYLSMLLLQVQAIHIGISWPCSDHLPRTLGNKPIPKRASRIIPKHVAWLMARNEGLDRTKRVLIV